MTIGPDIVVEEVGPVRIVRIDGRLDASSTPIVENKIKMLLEVADKIIIDFRDVDYLSSAGLRLLLSATKKLKAKDGMLAFFGFSDDVLEIIQMAGFERILNIFSNEKEALKAFESS